jgi:phosphoserine phosphatase/putative flippase GtrA
MSPTTSGDDGLIDVYDFDHTIYDGDASRDFLLFCLRTQSGAWRELPGQIFATALFLLGVISRDRYKERAFAVLKRLPDPEAVVHEFWRRHRGKVAGWYLAQRRTNDVIVSASPAFLLAPFAAELNATLIGTRMDSSCGSIVGRNCRGEEKVRRLAVAAPGVPIDRVYSDSLSDLPILKLGRRPYIVHKGVATPLAEHKESPLAKFKSPAFIRFLLVGVVNAGLGVLLAYAMTFVVHEPRLAFVLGYALSLVFSYFLNAFIVFRTRKVSLVQFARFCTSYLPNFAIQLVCVFILIGAFHFIPLLTYVASVVIAVPVTFALLHVFTFRKAPA